MPGTNSDPTTVHRLHDMETEEVSLVDRAANKRKFLVVKREGVQKMPTEVMQRPDGSFTAQPAASVAAPAAAPAVATPEATTTAKAGAALTKDAQAALKDVLEQALDMITSTQEMVDGAKIVEDEGEMTLDALCDPMMQAAEMLEDACAAMTGLDEYSDDEGGEESEPADDAQAAEPAAANQPGPPLTMGMGKRLEVRRAKRVLAKAAGFGAARTFVAKYGSKMKKDRLNRFQSALNVLSSILGEITPAMAGDLAKAKKAPPGAAPTAGAASPTGPDAANKPPAAMSPSMGDKKKKPGEPTAKSEEVATLEKRMNDLTVTIQKQAEELTRLRGVSPSNAVPVERQPAAKEENFSWPLDMNYAPEPAGGKLRLG